MTKFKPGSESSSPSEAKQDGVTKVSLPVGVQFRLLAQIFRAGPGAGPSGFTIIESLMALVVVAILMTALFPMLTVSVATRLQAKRVEQATQAARSYMDRVVANPVSWVASTSSGGNGPPFASSNVSASTSISLLTSLAPPNSLDVGTYTAGATLNCPTSNAYCITPPSLFCVNLDNTPGCQPNSTKDLLIFASRTTTAATTQAGIATAQDDATIGYKMAVRVYRAISYQNGLRVTNGRKLPPYTGGTGNSAFPLVEMTVNITSPGTTGAPSLTNLCKLYQSSTSVTTVSNCQ